MQAFFAELFGCTLLMMAILLSHGSAVVIAAAYGLLTAVLEPVSGAYLNPAYTVVGIARGSLSLLDGIGFMLAQVTGGLAGYAASSALA